MGRKEEAAIIRQLFTGKSVSQHVAHIRSVAKVNGRTVASALKEWEGLAKANRLSQATIRQVKARLKDS